MYLWPLLENSDIFIASYADANKPHVWWPGLASLISQPQKKKIERIFNWFYNSNSISNAGKSNLIVSSKENSEIDVSNWSMKNQGSVLFLGIHSKKTCEGTKETPCFSYMARIANYMGINERIILMKSFVFSRFSDCLLIWMVHSRNIGQIASIERLKINLWGFPLSYISKDAG